MNKILPKLKAVQTDFCSIGQICEEVHGAVCGSAPMSIW